MNIFLGALVIILIAIVMYSLIILVLNAEYKIGHITVFSIILMMVILSCRTFIGQVA